MMMVSANDAAYAVAETVGGSISGFAADLNATAKRYGMRDSTWGDPAGLTDGTSYEGGPKVSAYDLAIAARNALTVPAIAQWADTRTYDFTDPSGLHHELDQPQQVPPRQRIRLRRRQRLQDGIHRGRRPHAGRDREAQRAPVHRGDPRIGRQRLHVGGVAPRQVLAEAARRDHRRISPAGRRVAVRRPRLHDAGRVHEPRGRQHRRRARGQDGEHHDAEDHAEDHADDHGQRPPGRRGRHHGRHRPPTPPRARASTAARSARRRPGSCRRRRSRRGAPLRRRPAHADAGRVPAGAGARGVRGAAAARGEAPARPAHRPSAGPGEGDAQREPAGGRRPLPHRARASVRRSSRACV